MKANYLVNGLLATSLAVAGIALAFGGLDLWTDQDDTRHAYFDDDFRLGQTRIDARFIPGGSTTEDQYQLQIGISAGSTSEAYVARVPVGSELPTEVEVSRAGRGGNPVGTPVGSLLLESGDREALNGELFGRALAAEAYSLGR